MTKILRTAASRLAQGGNKNAEQRKKAQRRLRKCKKNELNDPSPQKLNYRLRLIFSIFLFSLLTFTLCTAPCAFAANGTLTQEDGYYLIEDEADLAAFSEGVNNSTLASANARLTADIDLSVYENWTPIGNETNKYAGIFDGRGHAINGLAVNMTDAGGAMDVYAGLFGWVSGTVKNLTVQGAVVVDCAIDNIYAGGVAGKLESGTVENCKSNVSIDVNKPNKEAEPGNGNYAGGIVGYIDHGSVRNCESSGGVKASILNGTNYSNAGGIASINDGGEIANCTSSGTVEAYSQGQFTCAGGIVGSNRENSTVSNCVSYSSVKADGHMTSITGGIAGSNFGTLENCLVNAESISGEGQQDGPAAALVTQQRQRCHDRHGNKLRMGEKRKYA